MVLSQYKTDYFSSGWYHDRTNYDVKKFKPKSLVSLNYKRYMQETFTSIIYIKR